MANIAGTLVYVFNNQTGNVEALYKADSSNELLAEYEYTPFGETRRQSGELAAKNPLRYSTRYQEGNTGLYYYGFRHYSPVTKKWLSQDPLEERGGFNLYQFSGNDPVNSVDILGLCNHKNGCTVRVRVGDGFDDGNIEENKTFPLNSQVAADARAAAENGTIGVSDFTIPVSCSSANLNATLSTKVVKGHQLSEIIPTTYKTTDKITIYPEDDIVFDNENDTDVPKPFPMPDLPGREPISFSMLNAIYAIKDLCKLECPRCHKRQCPSINLLVLGSDSNGNSVIDKNTWWTGQLKKAARCGN